MPQLRDNTKDKKAYKNNVPGYWYYNHLPHWEMNIPFKYMKSCQDNNNIIAVGVTGVSRPLFMFYKRTCPWYTIYEPRHDPTADKWVKYDRVIVDPNSSSRQYMQLVNIVGVDGKFYALSQLGTLVLIEEVDSRMIITRVSSSRAVPSVPSRYFREYLLSSDGDIWRIFLLYSKSTSVVDDVEIFRLQMENIAWKKVEKLGKDRAVFAGANNCSMVTASEIGCKGNCVYFTNPVVNGWWVYDVARGEILPCSRNSDSGAIFGPRTTN